MNDGTDAMYEMETFETRIKEWMRHKPYRHYNLIKKQIVMNEKIAKQINRLEEEQQRVKQFLNENEFDCTTAPYVIAKEYRDAIKKHIEVLRMNIEY